MAETNDKVSYDGLTAGDVLAPNANNDVDQEAAERAESAGVVDAAYVDYEVALKNYEARPDVETLEQRLARENGGTFGAAAFVREGKSEVAAATAATTPKTAAKSDTKSDSK